MKQNIDREMNTILSLPLFVSESKKKYATIVSKTFSICRKSFFMSRNLEMNSKKLLRNFVNQNIK